MAEGRESQSAPIPGIENFDKQTLEEIKKHYDLRVSGDDPQNISVIFRKKSDENRGETLDEVKVKIFFRSGDSKSINLNHPYGFYSNVEYVFLYDKNGTPFPWFENPDPQYAVIDHETENLSWCGEGMCIKRQALQQEVEEKKKVAIEEKNKIEFTPLINPEELLKDIPYTSLSKVRDLFDRFHMTEQIDSKFEEGGYIFELVQEIHSSIVMQGIRITDKEGNIIADQSLLLSLNSQGTQSSDLDMIAYNVSIFDEGNMVSSIVRLAGENNISNFEYYPNGNIKSSQSFDQKSTGDILFTDDQEISGLINANYQYSRDNNLSSITIDDTDSSYLETFTVLRDNDQNITAFSDNSRTEYPLTILMDGEGPYQLRNAYREYQKIQQIQQK